MFGLGSDSVGLPRIARALVFLARHLRGGCRSRGNQAYLFFENLEPDLNLWNGIL